MPVIETVQLEKNYSVGFWRKRRVAGLKPLNLAVEAGAVGPKIAENLAGFDR